MLQSHHDKSKDLTLSKLQITISAQSRNDPFLGIYNCAYVIDVSLGNNCVVSIVNTVYMCIMSSLLNAALL